jgi:cell division septum initiation protein DivIVA
MKTLSPQPYSASPLKPSASQKSTLRYKENVAALFQRLNSLQQSSEATKSQAHSTLVSEFSQQESKVLGRQKGRAEQLASILRAVANIEKEMEDQNMQQEKVKRTVRTLIEAAGRELENSFDQMERERIKSENALQQWIENKLESFVLRSIHSLRQTKTPGNRDPS